MIRPNPWLDSRPGRVTACNRTCRARHAQLSAGRRRRHHVTIGMLDGLEFGGKQRRLTPIASTHATNQPGAGLDDARRGLLA